MSLDAADKKNRSRWPVIFLMVFLLAILTAAGVVYRLHEGEMPEISLAGEVGFIGATRTISFAAADQKSGIREVKAVLIQNGRELPLLDRVMERGGYFSHSGPNRLEDSFQVDAKALALQEGPADLVLSVRDFSWRNWLQGNMTSVSQPVVVDTQPPLISVQDNTRYVKNGGAGVVVYRSSEPIQDHGVVLGEHFHPGHPLSGQGGNLYVAYIGIPYDAAAIGSPSVKGVDGAGNIGQAAVGFIFRRKPLKSDRINVGDSFLAQKLPEFGQYYALTGTPVEQYVTVNNQVRVENNKKIAEVCTSSVSERLWQGRFSRMARSSPRAGFADHRSYFYQGQKIDEQDHLGVDLASVQHAEVEAANRGKVAFADYLGIYGNTVILDHGQGLFSLYSHLSQIRASPGDLVEQGGGIGLTGTTGMAGGDHLHLSILVNGVFVDPLEWWDTHWLQVSIEDFL